MTEQHFLDPRPGDVVPGGDDDVVRARLVPEVAVTSADVGVAGQVPAVLHVIALPVIGQVLAAGRALDGEAAWLAIGNLLAVLVQDGRLVAGDRQAGRPWADRLVGGRDEDVQDLGAADAVDDLHSGGVEERLPDRGGQVLAGRDRAAQAAQLPGLARREHGPVGGRRGRADGDAAGGYVVGQLRRGRLLQQQGGRSEERRENQQPAEPVGERERRRAGEDVVGRRPQHPGGERVGGGQHLPA